MFNDLAKHNAEDVPMAINYFYSQEDYPIIEDHFLKVSNLVPARGTYNDIVQ